MKIFTKNLILAILLLTGFAVHAQKDGNISGRVIDSKDKKPVDYASVVIKSTVGDSSVVGSAVTVATGLFEIKGLAPGTYKMYAAFLGFKTYTRMITIGADKANIALGDVALENDGVNLSGVEIKGEIPPVRVKKDTLEFNAAAFKVKENAVVEDVLKKLPGVEVDKAGTITTQGETIKKVRVDGKDFMGSDPLLATRNLPADMIDKIQIIDDLSDQAKFSGVDDGNREKIINITTKQDKKNGYFGNSSIGYGTDDRYDANINVNKFKGDQQFSLIGQFNNVNKQSFGGGGGGFGGGGRTFTLGGGGGASSGNGITTTNAAGINFADTYTDQTQINGSYFFNKTSNLNTSTSFTQNLFGNNSSTVYNSARATTERTNHRFNFTIDTKLDSNTSIRVQPNISYTESTGNSTNAYDRSVLATQTKGSQQYNTNTQTPTISNSLLIRHKFQRRGRSISLNVNTNINDSDAGNYNIISDYVTSGAITIPKLTNQLNDNSTKAISNTARLVYTEPLSKTMSLELNYQNIYSNENSERLVYNYNAITNSYDLIDPAFTNNFENTTLSNSLGFSLNKTEKKYNWNIGLAVQNTDRENLNLSTGKVLNQNFYNLTPTAQYRYNFTQSKRFEFRYRGNTNQPSISQIQPIADNTNTQSYVVGNPNLRPSFGNNFNLNYRDFNFTTFRNFFVFANFTQTFNDFASDSRLITNIADPNFGKIATTSVNVDGNYSGFVSVTIGQPIVKGNKLSLSLTGGANFNRAAGFANGNSNIQKALGINGNLKLVSNLDKLDLTGGFNVRYDNQDFSYQTTSNTQYYTITPSIDVSYLFPGNIRLQTDIYYNKLTGRGAAYDTDYTLMNAFISRQFFKNRGTFKIAANDILNQNTGISRTATPNQIQDINFNVLKRYYMFSFTYSLNRVGGRTMGAGDGMRPPGMGQTIRMN